MNSSEPYSETVGNPPESLTELQKRHVEAVRQRLAVCEHCQHGWAYHGDTCHYPQAPRGEDCGCEHKKEQA